MGMDVYGKNPKNEVGSYFRRNVWGWHPLWEYCERLHPEVAGAVQYGHSNDGDGLEEQESLALAKLLRLDLADGTTERYIAERNEYLANLPRLTCELCEGTGIRTDSVGVEAGFPEKLLAPEIATILGREKGWCNGCSGEGLKEAWETNYGVDAEDIAEFAEFLENCGGFEIC